MPKTKLISLLLIFLVIPLVYAGECGITNLAACIPEKIYEYLLDVINAPLQPLLELVKTLLQEPVNVDLFIGLWAIIIYVISLFYGILFMYAGFNFMISGYDAEKKRQGKSMV